MSRRSGINSKKRDPYLPFRSSNYPPYGSFPLKLMLTHPEAQHIVDTLSEAEKVDALFELFESKQKVAFYYKHRYRPHSTRPNPGLPVYMKNLKVIWETEGLLYHDISPHSLSLEGELYKRYDVWVFSKSDGQKRMVIKTLEELEEKLSKPAL